ncbi:MAG TPA: hypothetical protein VJP80_07080 [Candidatus Saccharimonadales bacterium]|nr:hypothetical protein [Candidatus Saccharimonadales bacterium]
MTSDQPATTQLGRFKEEYAPALEEKYDELLGPYIEQLDQAGTTLADRYHWLAETCAAIGTSFLEVPRIDPSQHAEIDLLTGLELDYGPKIKERLIQIDPQTGEIKGPVQE